jgi:hypothetical protein
MASATACLAGLLGSGTLGAVRRGRAQHRRFKAEQDCDAPRAAPEPGRPCARRVRAAPHRPRGLRTSSSRQASLKDGGQQVPGSAGRRRVVGLLAGRTCPKEAGDRLRPLALRSRARTVPRVSHRSAAPLPRRTPRSDEAVARSPDVRARAQIGSGAGAQGCCRFRRERQPASA